MPQRNMKIFATCGRQSVNRPLIDPREASYFT